MDVLLEFIKTVLAHQNPADKLKELAELVDDVFQLMPSGKHMVGRDLGRMEPTAALQYRATGWFSKDQDAKNLKTWTSSNW